MPTPSYQTRADSARRFVTQFAFRTRVGDSMVAAMDLAAQYNAADAADVQLAKAKARAQMARAFSAEWLDLDDAELRGGFAGIPEDDFNRIFLAPVRDKERP